MRQIVFYISIFFLIFLLWECKNESVNSPEMLTHSQWQALNIENYEFERSVICFCAPPAGRFHKIIVESGAIVEIIDLEDDRSLPSENFDFFKTIPSFSNLLSLSNPDSVAILNVEYDSSIGFPSSIYVDFNQADCRRRNRL